MAYTLVDASPVIKDTLTETTIPVTLSETEDPPVNNIERNFVDPVLLAVGKFLMDDARAAGTPCSCCSNIKDRSGKVIGQWCSDLSNFSAACRHMRKGLWGSNLKNVTLREGEDMSHLESMIPLEWRHHVRYVIILIFLSICSRDSPKLIRHPYTGKSPSTT